MAVFWKEVRVLLLISSVILFNADAARTVNSGASFRSSLTNNIISFNNGVSTLPHSAHNFNVLGSALSESHQDHRPVFFHRRRPVTTVLFPGKRFTLSRPEENQPGSTIKFGNNPSFSSPISFHNTPKFQMTEEAKRAPIIFGSRGGSLTNKPTVSSGSRGVSVSNKPAISSGDINPSITPNNNTGNNVNLNNVPSIDNNCTLDNRQIWYNDSCSTLLVRDSCEENEWLVLSSDEVPVCQRRACPGNFLLHNNQCVDVTDLTLCPRGQMLYVDLFGDVNCDCITGYYFDDESGSCYAQHEQGVCEESFYMEFDENVVATCVPNPCIEDDLVEYENKCYQKNYRGYCQPILLEINDSETSADCINLVLLRSIFNAPTLRSCPRGSRRDHFRKCRALFRVPTQNTMKAVSGSCKTYGFKLDAEGNCRLVYSLFG